MDMASSASFVPVEKFTISSLSSAEADQLLLLYKEMIPRYKFLCEKYEEMKTKAANARRKTTFPCMADWTPPGGLLENDTLYLQQLQTEIRLYKDLFIVDPNTQRKIKYSSGLYERSSRHMCSYVRIDCDAFMQNSEHRTFTFGKIQKLFDHSFGGGTHRMATLLQFDSNHTLKDNESQLWYVCPSRYESIIVPLEFLSRPLVCATEGDTLWVLNPND